MSQARLGLDAANTNLQQLRRLLADSTGLAQALLDQSPLAILMVDGQGTVRRANQRWLDLFKADGAGVVDRFNLPADPQFQAIGVQGFLQRALAGETVLLPDFEFDAEAAGIGTGRRWLRSHLFAAPVDGQPHVVVAQLDISSCMQCEERYNIVVDNANEAIMVVQDGLLKFFNAKALAIAGYADKSDFLNKPFVHFVPPDHQQMIMDRHLRRQRGEAVPNFYQVKVIHKLGHIIWLQLNAVRIDWEGRPASLVFLYDITAHKKAEEELERYRTQLEEMVRQRTRELEKALEEVRTLKGLIPVCVHCKDIRDDKGYWKRMEDYLRTHSEADVTHGLCPACAQKLYPELFRTEADLQEFRALGRSAPGEPPPHHRRDDAR